MAGRRSAFQRGASPRRAAQYDYGSKQRLKRIRLRGNSSLEFWIFVIGLVLILLIAVPWLVTHPPQHQHHAE
jgi:hypothetical protein